MENRINILTLGVSDLDGMTKWYKEIFGWTPIKNSNGIVYFRLNGLILVLTHEQLLARNLYVWHDDQEFKGFTLTISFNSEEEVDKIFSELRKKDVLIIKEPDIVPCGAYKGYIADPENNFWELAYYPFVAMGKTVEKFLIEDITYQ
jgi:catechol 2,3-dioxygenase-like lactoylglutathione lyase family enzyme